MSRSFDGLGPARRAARPSRRAAALLAAAAAAAALALAGCPGEPEATLGTESDGFVPLADGDELLVFLGPQGLYMFVVAFRARNLHPGNPDDLDDPRNPEVRVTLTLDGVPVGGMAAYAGLLPQDDGSVGLSGVFVPFDVDRAAVVDRQVLVELTITDRRGRIARHAVLVTARASN